MPWKYFWQITLSLILLSGVTMVYIVVNWRYMTLPRPVSASAERVTLSSAGLLASPSVLACGGEGLFLGTGFEVYAARLPDTPPLRADQPWPLQLQPLFLSEKLQAPWAALATLHGPGPRGYRALLLLERKGRAVLEQPLSGAFSVSEQHRRWPLSESLDASLLHMTALEGHAATKYCGGGNTSSHGSWAVVGLTDADEALVLCPRGSRLQPARRLARLRQRGAGEVLALHADAGGLRWHLVRTARDALGDVVELWPREGQGMAPETWLLPQDHRWAAGACELQRGGFLLVAEAGQPELWHLPATQHHRSAGSSFDFANATARAAPEVII